jgi:hypothetical protein
VLSALQDIVEDAVVSVSYDPRSALHAALFCAV